MANQASLVADTDAGFVKLREDIRREIRVAEMEFREAISDLVKVFPANMVGDLQSMIFETPARFIRGMLPFFSGLSEMRDREEAFMRVIRRQSGSLN